MATARINGVDLYYEVRGEGLPILGVHGTPSSTLFWEDAAQELGHHGRCIIYDRRGFGRSERPEPFWSLDLVDHVEDATALLDALDARPALVIGRSTGGLVALELAHRHPDAVRALVLLEPAVFTMDVDATRWGGWLRDAVLQSAAADPSSASEVVVRAALGDATWASLPLEIQDLFAEASPAVLAETRGRGLDLSDDPLDLDARTLASLDTPTLVVAAEDSPEILRRVADQLTAALPGADHARVAGGHLIDPAHPVVLEFVDAVSGRGPTRG